MREIEEASMARIPSRIAVGLSAIALLGAVTACDEATQQTVPTAPPGLEATTTISVASPPGSPTTTVGESLLYEDQSREELIEIAIQKGANLGAVAREAGVPVDELTTAQIIEALRGLVIRSVSKGCHACWVR